MPKDFDPTEAVQSLVSLFEASKTDEIEIGSHIESHIKRVASLPEAAGLIGYDADKKVLYLIKGQN